MKRIIILSFCALLFFVNNGLGQTKPIFERADFLVVPGDSINTVASDISPCQIGDQLYYSSVRKPWWNRQHRLKKNMTFYNQYMIPLDENGNVIRGIDRKLVEGLGEDYHQGPVSYCAKTGELFVTESNTVNPDSVHGIIPQANIRLRIIVMKNKLGVWKETEEMPFNDKRYNFAHPAISISGDTLIFSSDMPGGLGKSDLYMSIRQSGRWSTPTNLGDAINTSGYEIYPSFLPGGLLSFASNGHQGTKGGLDIWYTTFPIVSGVKNAGDRINSQFDDFGLIINSNLKVGYLSSNRPGKGSDDIFKVEIKQHLYPLNVVCYDVDTKKVLPDITVKLNDSAGKTIDEKVSNEEGTVAFFAESTNRYMVSAVSKTYFLQEREINGDSLATGSLRQDIFLKKAACYLTIKVIDRDSKKIVPEAIVDITEGDCDQSKISKENGLVKMELNESTNYIFTASAERYFGGKGSFSSVNKSSGEYTLTIEIEKLEAGKEIVLEDLFYDVNKYDIRPDAAIVLDKLVKVLNENPDIRIEVGSHTDCRAPAAYNLKLSQNRSESVVNYLVSKGIYRDRLVPKGYGESQLVNKCVDGVPCAEEEHQANRRTVVKILNPGDIKIRRDAKRTYYF